VNDILIEETYAPGLDECFSRDAIPQLRDPRSIRVGGEPLLLIYRVASLPDPARTADLWRKICRQEGLVGVHLCAVQSFGIGDPRPYGFDSAVEFVPPHVDRELLDPKQWPGINPDFEGYLERYSSVVRRCLERPRPEYPWYRGAFPAWDNTPRRGRRAHILVESSPKLYEEWLQKVVEQSLERAPAEEPLVFINAWNEWAEGAYLEPDQRLGHAHLQATRRAACNAVANQLKKMGIEADGAHLEAMLESRSHLFDLGPR
jgi:lipopolysaccharide biosynthesis protein